MLLRLAPLGMVLGVNLAVNVYKNAIFLVFIVLFVVCAAIFLSSQEGTDDLSNVAATKNVSKSDRPENSQFSALQSQSNFQHF